MEKTIIYTCITGGYDVLQQPAVTAEDFEFICFVPKGSKKSEKEGVWKIEELPLEMKSAHILSRYPKLNPHEVLPSTAQYSLWMDGNIRIKDSSLFDICRTLRERKVQYAGIKHPFSDCAYEEARKCLKDRRDSLCSLAKTVKFLKRSGLPAHAGLMENCIIFRSHNDPAVMEFDCRWWDCLQKYSRRDQLTHTLCLRSIPAMKREYIFPEGVNVRNFPGVEYIKHPGKSLNWIQRKFKYGMNKPEGLILKLVISHTRPSPSQR